MVTMKLNKIPYEKIKSKSKIWEIRLNDDKRKSINIGDSILFKKLPDCLEGFVAKVVDKKYFNTFEDISKVLDLKDVGFDENANAQTCVDTYREYYSQDDEQKYGVVAFKLKLI